MSYYVEHGVRYINVNEYRIARYCYHRVKCLNSAVISFKSAREHTCIFVYVCVWISVSFCRLQTRTYGLWLKERLYH